MKHKNAYALLGIIQSYAPDAAAQQYATDEYNKILNREPGIDEREFARRMACILYNGLTGLDWPWEGLR